MSLTRVPFLDAVEDVSRGNLKIPQSELQPSGALAVVDQGQSLIAGYINDVTAAVKAPGPLIVFGDHTRALKFVTFRFAMGADGTKVLRVREGFDAKYVYWYLKALDLPSAGYSRHFKFLKEVAVPRPSLDEQRRIAAILDHADALRAKRRQVRLLLDRLIQAIYEDVSSEVCGEPVEAGEVMPSMRNGLSPASNGRYAATVLTLSAITRGRFDGTAVKPAVFSVDPPSEKRVSADDFLMCRGNGNKALVGAGVVAPTDRSDLVFPDTVIAGRVDTAKVVLPYLEIAWRQPEVRSQIERAARTTSGIHKVNQQTLSAVMIPLPSLAVQETFAERRQRVDAAMDRVVQAARADDELFASLQSRAFRGEL